MKKLIYLVSLTTLGIFLIFIYAGCSEESPIATTTTTSTTTTSTSVDPNATISGVGSLPIGVPGQIQNTRVALYVTVDDWNFDRTFKFSGCDVNGNYTMIDVPPAPYYIDAWKDNDANGLWGTSTDYVWVNGSGAYPNYTLAPISFPGGQTTTVNFTVFLVP